MLTNTVFGQMKSTYLYEIKLFKQFKHKAMWSKREHSIQERHIQYLKELTKKGKLKLAGIIAENVNSQQGLIILTTRSYIKTVLSFWL